MKLFSWFINYPYTNHQTMDTYSQFNSLLTTLLKQVLFYTIQPIHMKKKLYIESNQQTGPQLIAVLNNHLNAHKVAYCHFPPNSMDEPQVCALFNQVQSLVQSPRIVKAIQTLKSVYDANPDALNQDANVSDTLYDTLDVILGDDDAMCEQIQTLILDHLYLSNFYTYADTLKFGLGDGDHYELTDIPVKSILHIFVGEFLDDFALRLHPPSHFK